MMTKKYFSFSMLSILILVSGFLSACNKQEEPETDSVPPDVTGPESSTETQPTEVSDPLSEGALPSGTWTLNPEKSTLSYEASKVIGLTHLGEVKIKNGSLMVDEKGMITATEFIIDMPTITESQNNEMFLKHVKSDDFFGVEKFPEAKFALKKATFEKMTDAGAQYKIAGELTIRDKANPIDFEAVAVETETGLSVLAQFDIDRTKWDIKFNSSSFIQNLGDNAINDDIHFNLDLGFEK